MNKFIMVIGATGVATMMATAADAALYRFDLSGSRNASFTLESTKPALATDFQTQFQNVRGTFGGAHGVASAVSFGKIFFISALDVANTSLGFTQFGGPVLFTGPTSNPVFNIGSFALNGIVSGESTLKIALAPVPEPATWLLMLSGLGLAAHGLKRRTKAVRLPRSA